MQTILNANLFDCKPFWKHTIFLPHSDLTIFFQIDFWKGCLGHEDWKYMAGLRISWILIGWIRFLISANLLNLEPFGLSFLNGESIQFCWLIKTSKLQHIGSSKSELPCLKLHKNSFLPKMLLLPKTLEFSKTIKKLHKKLKLSQILEIQKPRSSGKVEMAKKAKTNS